MREDLFEVGFPVEPEESFTSARAEVMYRALRAHENFELRERKILISDAHRADTFVVQCTNHEVPGRNAAGIGLQEALAIIVWADPTRLPEVLALRRDFPVTLHQNAVAEGQPANLCLYFDRPADVLRTWTPQGFLRRIQWWLAETAKGTLHRLDQPVEQLFLETPIELILPPNFEHPPHSDGADPLARLSLSAVIERADGALTFFTRFNRANEIQTPANLGARIVAFTSEPVQHGAIAHTPFTLGSLDAVMRSRGAPVMERLLDHVREYVGESGRRREAGISATILLLRIPIVREAGGPVERLERSGFWIRDDLLTIGESAGLLIKTPERPETFYVDHLSPMSFDAKTDWRALPLVPLNLLDTLTPELARVYSGVRDQGPQAVLAGGGALGAELYQLWRRAGWGRWTVIDPDHLRPHNPSRHPSARVGHYKAVALAEFDETLFPLQGKLTKAIVANATAVDNPDVASALQSASLIVDVTTTVEVPRRLACLDNIGRIVTCFVSPTGRDAVLLSEDAARTYRIDAIEAQYYRAVLHEEWGQEHLARNGQQFRSGAGCRDLSLVLPYTRIVAHASNLADCISDLDTAARIAIWRRDFGSGAVSAFTVEVSAPLYAELSPFTLLWDAGLRAKLRSIRKSALPSETGGVLLGYHDFNEGRIFVVDALPAPPDSLGTPVGFRRGVEGLAGHLDAIRERTGGQVSYLGEWHSHPDSAKANPSRHDIRQLLYLGVILREDGLPGLQLIVADDDEQWLLVR